jgi:hypothetical protein
MTVLDLIQTATQAARRGDIDGVEACFDRLNELDVSPADRHQVGCIIADCCSIADSVRSDYRNVGTINDTVGGEFPIDLTPPVFAEGDR